MKDFKEFAEALLGGETLVNDVGTMLHLDQGDIVDHHGEYPSVAIWKGRLGEWKVYKEPEWFEDIPEEGVLCWVQDNVFEKPTIARIVAYKPGVIRKYREAHFSSWIHATPLTDEEIDSFKRGKK